MNQSSCPPRNVVMQYRVHLLVFLVAFFIAITLAHPAFFVNDEWITANQLSQLHDGQQLMFNEGKYGTYENGTASVYFSLKDNILGYSLFLPIISLPAYWLLDLIGDNCVFFLIYLWTFLLIFIALVVNSYFPSAVYFGKWRWTSGLIVGAFVLFFVNMYYYRPFFIMGDDTYPEILAIVSTNILLFAILAVMVYEINRTIFQDTVYAFFGTIVCLSCSSYLFWTNFCKDHLLVAFLFTIIVLLVVKFFDKKSVWYLCGAFVFSGLLAWERPELALFVCISLYLIVAWIYFGNRDAPLRQRERRILLCSPLFTFIGAIPFFINNYLFTKNIFVPASVLWRTAGPVVTDTVTGSANTYEGTPDMFGSLVSIVIHGINLQTSTFFADLYGIFFNPQTSALGLFPVMPLALSGIILLAVLAITRQIHFSPREKQFLIAMTLLSLGVFFAYMRDLHGMNTSVGINPDIRYLSPMYLPLNIMSLIVLAKVPGVIEKAETLLKWMVTTCIIVIPVSSVAMAWYYPFPELWAELFPLLHLWTSVGVYLIIALYLVCSIYGIFFNKPGSIPMVFLAILCSLPFIWQVNATFLMRFYGTGFGGYSFWIPVVLKTFGLIYSSQAAIPLF
jgi:hypothetical protein